MTVSDMAKKLEITEMAVRRHLGTLERSSLIGSEAAPAIDGATDQSIFPN